MFGFPERVSDWGSKDYLRLFTFVMVYISLRPLIQAFYNRLGERSRKRQAKLEEDKQIQEMKLRRVRELVDNPDSQSDSDSETDEEELESTSTLRQRKNGASKPAKAVKTKREQILDEMPSDDDISDLVQ